MAAKWLIEVELACRNREVRLGRQLCLESPSLLGLVTLVLERLESLRRWLDLSLKELAALEVFDGQNPRLILVPVFESM